MKKIIFLPLILVLASCGTKSDTDPRTLSLTESLKNSGIFGNALVSNPELGSVLSSNQHLVIVVPTDKALSNITLNSTYIKNYISQDAITAPGLYGTLGTIKWNVTDGYPGTSVFLINDKKINGCAQSYTTEQAAQNKNWSYLCFTDTTLN